MKSVRWISTLAASVVMAWTLSSCGGGGGGGSSSLPTGTGVGTIITSVTSLGAPAGIQGGVLPSGPDQAPVAAVVSNNGGGSYTLSVNSTEPLTDLFVGVAGQTGSYYDINEGGTVSSSCPSPTTVNYMLNVTFAPGAGPVTLLLGSHNVCDRFSQQTPVSITGSTTSGTTGGVTGATSATTGSTTATTSATTGTTNATTSATTGSTTATTSATTGTTNATTTSGTTGTTTSTSTSSTNGTFGTTGSTSATTSATTGTTSATTSSTGSLSPPGIPNFPPITR